MPGQLRQTIASNEPLGRCCPGAFSNESVPPPHPPVAGDEPLPDGKRLAAVTVDDTNLAQTAIELGGGLHMVGEAFESSRERRIAVARLAPLPAPRPLRPDFRIGIVAERRRKRLLVARLRAKPRQDRAAAMIESAGERVMLGAGRR